MGGVREVLFLHHSADLYGSDKVLHSLVTGLRDRALHPIVLLPEPGPLHQLLLSAGIETHIAPLAKLQRVSWSPRGMITLPFRLIYSLMHIRRLLARRNVDLVYTNTLAVLPGAVYARLAGIPHLWHVHEIVTVPRVAGRAFAVLVRLLADRVICNSHATRQWLTQEQPALSGRLITIWNGVDRPTACCAAAASAFRARVAAGEHDVVVTLLGRINRMKGQMLLVDAAEILWAQACRRLRFAIVGDAPREQVYYEARLRERIARSPAKDSIFVLAYAKDVWPVWEATDIAVVPSTEPESFGLVAIEAMAAGKPVVAAAHGGVLDIVEDQESGLLVPAGDAQALAAAITRLCDDSALRSRMGEAGRRRQAAYFSRTAQLEKTRRCMMPPGVTDG